MFLFFFFKVDVNHTGVLLKISKSASKAILIERFAFFKANYFNVERFFTFRASVVLIVLCFGVEFVLFAHYVGFHILVKFG